MANRAVECNRIDLESLLAEEQIGAGDHSTLAHLEKCLACQRRLESLAASDEWWHECQSQLGSSSANDPDLLHDSTTPMIGEAQFGEDGVPWASDDVSHLLAPPSHPEMLGRIGRYEVERLLGRGGMGVVFKAFDSELHRPVAIKVLAPHLAGSGAARQRFGREARAAAAVVHEHVVSIHDVEVGAAPPYLVMQYVPGESLQAYVDRLGPLDPCDLARIGHQIAAGLAAAHAQGLVHRDIKPSNIMLENGLSRVVITDFGLARAADDASLTRSGVVAGTPHYMSPEQARGEAADARCDLFSLGAVLYFMATGHPPFRAEQAMAVLHRICQHRQRPVSQINPRVPGELADVIDRLLEKKPCRRYASASDAQRVLANVLSDMQAPRRWLGRPLLRRIQKNKWQIASAAIGLAVVALAWIWWPGLQGPAPIVPGVGPEPGASPAAASVASEEETQRTAAATALPEFAREVAAVRQSLQALEGPPPGTTSPGLSVDPWIESLRAARKSAFKLETSWSDVPDRALSVESSESSKGENP